MDNKRTIPKDVKEREKVRNNLEFLKVRYGYHLKRMFADNPRGNTFNKNIAFTFLICNLYSELIMIIFVT